MIIIDLKSIFSDLIRLITAVQSQKAVSAYFTSKQILPFGFAQHYSRYMNTGLFNIEHSVSIWLSYCDDMLFSTSSVCCANDVVYND